MAPDIGFGGHGMLWPRLWCLGGHGGVSGPLLSWLRLLSLRAAALELGGGSLSFLPREL